MKRIKHFLLASCVLPALLGAQEVANASFMEITPDAQSAGMGGTGMAIINNGSTAVFHNISTIAFSQDVMGATYSYADINKDFSEHSASLFYRIGREGKHGLAIGYRHFSQPDFFIGDGEDATDFRPRVWSLEAGYFRSVSKSMALSLTLKYLQAKNHPDSDSKNAVCIDLGASYHQNMSILNEMASWTIGFQAANIGTKLDGQRLPARLGLGGSIDLPFSMANELQIALDLNYLLPSQYRHLQTSIGAEYKFLKYAVVRGGYHLGDKDKGVGNYGTVGCGIHYWPIRADFSYALASSNSFMHRTWQLSIGVVF